MTAVDLISYIINVITFSIFIRVILSWIVITFGVRHNIVIGLFQFFIQITEPMLAPLRRIVPPVGGMLDLSPIIALVILQIISYALLRL